MSVYEFGNFRLDLTEGCLLRGEQFQPLPPKPFEVLAQLIQKAGHLITKEELMDKVWPNVAVEDNNLTVSVSKIRKALGESKRQPKYIVTVPGRGYRFVAKVTYAAKFESILVLPFDGTVLDADSGNLAETFTESLTYQLSNLTSLRVIPLSSILHYKGGPGFLNTLASQLNVSLTLAGRLTVSGEILTISIQLVDPRRNKLLWGRRYHSALTDVLSFQSEIVKEVFEKVEAQVRQTNVGSDRPLVEIALSTVSLIKRTFPGSSNREDAEGFPRTLRCNGSLE